MLLGTMSRQDVMDQSLLAEGRQFYITGAYYPAARSRRRKEWVSFAYGPFPTRKICEERANDDEAMMKALGSVAKAYEIDCTDPLRYNQACKHFEETLKSEFKYDQD